MSTQQANQFSQAQLHIMLTLQNNMNCKVNPEWLSAGYGYLRAAMVESVEAIEHHGWKWWKAQHLDLPQLQMECVDIWHFALSHLIIQFNGDINQTAEALTEQLALMSGSVTFDGQDYAYQDQNLLSNLELMAGLAAAKRFDVGLFLTILHQSQMDADELFRQYVGKNVLNFFRQDNGYKDGTYHKLWDGREDNEHLVEILDTLDPQSHNYADKVYAGLQERYPS